MPKGLGVLFPTTLLLSSPSLFGLIPNFLGATPVRSPSRKAVRIFVKCAKTVTFTYAPSALTVFVCSATMALTCPHHCNTSVPVRSWFITSKGPLSVHYLLELLFILSSRRSERPNTILHSKYTLRCAQFHTSTSHQAAVHPVPRCCTLPKLAGLLPNLGATKTKQSLKALPSLPRGI
ncbi:hypothetical protein IWW34DRAFT_732602 [Fusarium oxysporum f. sp. albedinis]|nr:hypothetical protein IWW34DRAFT_732602 [Fusarium oxysporum f. sp. albedinis]